MIIRGCEALMAGGPVRFTAYIPIARQIKMTLVERDRVSYGMVVEQNVEADHVSYSTTATHN
jgi:hypothetical protein